MAAPEFNREVGEDMLKIPREMMVPEGRDDLTVAERLVEAIYSNICDQYNNLEYFADRVILSPKNDDARKLNEEVLQKLPGQLIEYLSIDSVQDENAGSRHLYPQEFLNTLDLSGMPPHRLKLKVGTPIMLLRNLNSDAGLCNGTRLQVR